MTVLRSGSASDVGRVRSNNQDLALETSNLFAVADGMGGHVGGEVAAQLAVQSLRQAFDRHPSAQGLVDAIGAANQAVWTEGQEQADLRGMGTTLTVAALVQGSGGRDVLALANVGDSRAYVFADGQLSQVTSDHSLAEERVRQGAMTEQEAAVHPHRHILTRALGVGPGVDVDLWELDLKTGDRLLLCSDGLTNEVSDVEIAALLEERSDPSDAARVLVDLANQHGGNDNITVVVVDVLVGEEGDGSSRPSGPAAATALAAGAGAAAATADEAGAGADPGGVARCVAGGRSGYGLERGEGRSRDGAGLLISRSDDGVTSVVPAVGSATANGMRSGDRTRGMSTAVAAPPTTTGIVVAPGAPPPPRRPDPKSKRENRRRRRRRQPRAITFRVVLFVLLFAGSRRRRLLLRPLVRHGCLLRHRGPQPAGHLSGSCRRRVVVQTPRRRADRCHDVADTRHRRLDRQGPGDRAQPLCRSRLRQQPAPGGDLSAAALQRIGTVCREPGPERPHHGPPGDHHYAADDSYLRYDDHGPSQWTMRQQDVHDQGACMTTA